jgi:hypothetical protein
VPDLWLRTRAIGKALRLSHLGAAERRAYVLADNKLALNAGWDRELLAIELQALIDVDFDVEVTGFSLAEIDLVLDEAGESSPEGKGDEADRLVPPPELAPRSPARRPVQLGDHRLLCGDSRKAESFAVLMEGGKADLVFTDPSQGPQDRLI